MIKIERKKKSCRFWAGRYSGPGLALYCETENGIRAYPFQAGWRLQIEKPFDLSALQKEARPYSLKLVKPDLTQEINVASFVTEKEAELNHKKALRAIRAMRIPGRAWVYWAVGALFVVGVLAASGFTASRIGTNTGGSSVGKPDAAAVYQPSPMPPFAGPMPPSQAVAVEPPAKADVSSLPPANHAWGFGNPKGKPLYVFSDPTCHYCGQLDRALKAVAKDYYIHLYPTPVLGPQGIALVANFACSANPQKAWDDWMTSQKINEKVKIEKECSSAALDVANSNIGAMKGLGFKGVPVIVRADGAAHNGAMTGEQLVEWLSQTK